MRADELAVTTKRRWRSLSIHTDSIRNRLVALLAVMLFLTLGVMGMLADMSFSTLHKQVNDDAMDARLQAAQVMATANTPLSAALKALPDQTMHMYLVFPDGRSYGEPMPPHSNVHERSAVLEGGELDQARLTMWVDGSAGLPLKTAFKYRLALTVLIAPIVAVLLALPFVHVALRPLSEVASAARRIADGERGVRLNPTNRRTEVGQAAASIDEMLDELEGSEARAQQAEDRMKSFLSDAVHELKTPLAGIRAASEALIGLPQENLAEREELEYLLGREAYHAGQLVNNLLEAARVDSGPTLHAEKIELTALLGFECERIALTRPDVAVARRPGEVLVQADRAAITSAIRNLIENATRMAGGGGWVEVWAQLATPVTGQPATAQVWVVDSGPGVPVSEREHIFGRLVRLNDPSNQSSGFGLGLPIARGYARAMGGDLVCCEPPAGYCPPVPGRVGAAFLLSLPVKSGSAG